VAKVRESFNTKASEHLDFTTLRTISKQMKREERRGSVFDEFDEEAVEIRTKCTFSENQGTKAHSHHFMHQK